MRESDTTTEVASTTMQRERPAGLQLLRLRGHPAVRAEGKMTGAALVQSVPAADVQQRSSNPSVPQALLSRDGLLWMLDRAVTKRVTVISAPAGSGKTSLLRAW